MGEEEEDSGQQESTERTSVVVADRRIDNTESQGEEDLSTNQTRSQRRQDFGPPPPGEAFGSFAPPQPPPFNPPGPPEQFLPAREFDHGPHHPTNPVHLPQHAPPPPPPAVYRPTKAFNPPPVAPRPPPHSNDIEHPHQFIHVESHHKFKAGHARGNYDHYIKDVQERVGPRHKQVVKISTFCIFSIKFF